MRNQASLCVLAHLGTACSSPKHVEWTGAKCKGYRWQSPRSLWLGWHFRVVCALFWYPQFTHMHTIHWRIHCSFKPSCKPLVLSSRDGEHNPPSCTEAAIRKNEFAFVRRGIQDHLRCGPHMSLTWQHQTPNAPPIPGFAAENSRLHTLIRYVFNTRVSVKYAFLRYQAGKPWIYAIYIYVCLCANQIYQMQSSIFNWSKETVMMVLQPIPSPQCTEIHGVSLSTP